MKMTNHHFKTIKELEEQLNLSDLDPVSTLVQVFVGLIELEEVQQIQSIIKEKNRVIPFIGTTTAGEIIQGDSVEKSIVISIIEFEKHKN